MAVGTEFVLVDERKGRQVAKAHGLQAYGTLGVIGIAAERKLVALDDALDRLQKTNFRVSPRLLKSVPDGWGSQWFQCNHDLEQKLPVTFRQCCLYKSVKTSDARSEAARTNLIEALESFFESADQTEIARRVHKTQGFSAVRQPGSHIVMEKR